MYTIGLYNPETSTFYLQESSSGGMPNVVVPFQPTMDVCIPVVGDWSGGGADDVGLYDPQTGNFYLASANAAGTTYMTINFRPTNDACIPVVGDWTGEGTTTIGVYDPKTSTFYERDEQHLRRRRYDGSVWSGRRRMDSAGRRLDRRRGDDWALQPANRDFLSPRFQLGGRGRRCFLVWPGGRRLRSAGRRVEWRRGDVEHRHLGSGGDLGDRRQPGRQRLRQRRAPVLATGAGQVVQIEGDAESNSLTLDLGAVGVPAGSAYPWAFSGVNGSTNTMVLDGTANADSVTIDDNSQTVQWSAAASGQSTASPLDAIQYGPSTVNPLLYPAAVQTVEIHARGGDDQVTFNESTNADVKTNVYVDGGSYSGDPTKGLCNAFKIIGSSAGGNLRVGTWSVAAPSSDEFQVENVQSLQVFGYTGAARPMRSTTIRPATRCW